MHKSSLSPCVYAIMGLEIGDHHRAYDYFMKTSYIDLLDLNKNAGDGIHGAATGGAWMTVIHGFAGMRIRRDVLCFDPWLPRKWQELSFSIVYCGTTIAVNVTPKSMKFKIINGKAITISVQGRSVRLSPKKTATVKLTKSA